MCSRRARAGGAPVTVATSIRQALFATVLAALSPVTAATVQASSPDQQHDEQQNDSTSKPAHPLTAEQAAELQTLRQELKAQNESFRKRPRTKFISASTRQPEYAAYMRHWVARIEQVGNLNYPEEARRQHLHGAPLLTVGVKRDGSIDSIELIRSSGSPLLDAAAQRIVRLAAPFAPLPTGPESIDVLYLTRSWEFAPGDATRDH